MRLRKQELGNRNLVGARVEAARKKAGMKQKELLAQLQVNGIDMNASGLSKLEGQIRYVTDFELLALALILDVSIEELLGCLLYTSLCPGNTGTFFGLGTSGCSVAGK